MDNLNMSRKSSKEVRSSGGAPHVVKVSKNSHDDRVGGKLQNAPTKSIERPMKLSLSSDPRSSSQYLPNPSLLSIRLRPLLPLSLNGLDEPAR